MLKILIGVGLGFLLFTNPEARQITGDVLRAAGDAIAPQKDGRTFEDRVKEALVEKVLEEVIQQVLRCFESEGATWIPLRVVSVGGVRRRLLQQ